MLAEPAEIPCRQNSHFLATRIKNLELAKLVQELCE